MTKVKMYSLESCPHCQDAKAFFKEKGIKFENIDVNNPKNAKKMEEKSGQRGVPVIEIDGKIIVGFDKEKVEELLEKK